MTCSLYFLVWSLQGNKSERKQAKSERKQDSHKLPLFSVIIHLHVCHIVGGKMLPPGT